MTELDMVKDDELIADPVHAPLYDRIEVCLRASEKAYQETGKKCVYLPNVTDRQDRMFEKAHRAIELGAEALMLNVHASGYGTLGALAEDDSINVPLLAHPCYAGAGLMGLDNSMAAHIILGKFMRLEGAEIVVYNSSYGKILSPIETYVRIGQTLLSKFHDLKPTFPCPAAGTHPGLIGQLMDDLGPDIVIGAGASMHAHPMGLKAGVAALNQAAEAWKLDVSPTEYAADHPELKAALDLWGVYDPNKSIFELTN